MLNTKYNYTIMNYLKAFEEMKQKLITIGAEINKSETELILTEDELPYLENEYKTKINNDVFKFYNNLNGIEFDWSLKRNDFLLTGFINIHSFYDLIMNSTENKLWANFYENDDIQEIKKHRILETIIGTDYYITIKIDPINGDYKLYYVPEGAVNNGGSKKLKEIPLKIDQYFEVITRYFGIHMIRHHLHEEKFYTHPFDVIPELKLLEKIIPDFKPPNITI
jgi:hypothetical protein